MSLRLFLVTLAAGLSAAFGAVAGPLPDGFVYLRALDPTILQDMKYYGRHNFIGVPIDGYEAPECILTQKAAEKLIAVHRELQDSGLAVKVFDCYRPQRSVAHFMRWSKNVEDQAMKAEFYPNIDKADFFKLGYVAEKSGHSRGSTVDLTVVPVNAPPSEVYVPGGKPLVACTSAYTRRFRDNGLDFGTAFDCMDPLSHPDNPDVPSVARHNRAMLAEIMGRHGFRPLAEEWWHFTLRDEPFPDTYFDFPVTAPQVGTGP